MYDYMIFHYCGHWPDKAKCPTTKCEFFLLRPPAAADKRTSQVSDQKACKRTIQTKKRIFSSERISRNISEKVPKFCKEENITWVVGAFWFAFSHLWYIALAFSPPGRGSCCCCRSSCKGCCSPPPCYITPGRGHYWGGTSLLLIASVRLIISSWQISPSETHHKIIIAG